MIGIGLLFEREQTGQMGTDGNRLEQTGTDWNRLLRTGTDRWTRLGELRMRMDGPSPATTANGQNSREHSLGI